MSELTVAILAGGLATRMQPLTEKKPKVLIDVAGEPFLSHQLRLLKKHGLTKIVLCVGHLGEMIVAKYGNGLEWGVRIDYSFDGEKLLGTGGALIKALPKLGDTFYVIYGDSYLPIDYSKVEDAFTHSNRSALMTVFENNGHFDNSNVRYENGEIINYSKTDRDATMKHIDYGLSLFRSSAFKEYPANTFIDLSEVQNNLCSRGALGGYEVHERFYEIGSPAGLKDLETLLTEAVSARTKRSATE